MFEQPAGKVEKDRSRLIMIMSAAAVLVVIGLIILVTSLGGGEKEMEMSHQGEPEFDSYAQYVKLSGNDKRTGERLGNKYGRIRCTVENTGDKTIIGLQLRGVAVGFNSEVYKEKIITPIPTLQETLGPNQTMEVDLYLEPIPDPSQVMDMSVNLYALKLR